LEGKNSILTLQSQGGVKTLGIAANILLRLSVNSKVTIAGVVNALDVANSDALTINDGYINI
jgi:hypothetical protein